MHRPTVCAVVVLWLLGCAQAFTDDLERQSVVEPFVAFMVAQHGFEPAPLSALLSEAVYQARIIQSMERPAERLPWHRYRRIFVTEERIKGGVAFWRKQRNVLQRAADRYHIPIEIIVAIIGIETGYGANRGTTKVLDALYTLAFHYPRRAQFFRGELVEFLLLARRGVLDPRTVVGSYAGAMGIPQFIPSSYQRFAVDFDGDGARNLLSGESDAIGSIANYLSQHQWQPQEAIALRAKVHGVDARTLLDAGYKPHTTLAALHQAGIQFTTDLPATTATALISLAEKESDEHWAVLDNFYVITRYNRSPLYAMAVFQLALAIKNKQSH